MRYIILVKATAATESGEMPSQELMGEVAGYTNELAKAGALYDATGLKPTSSGWRIRFRGEQRELIPGPFPDSPEIIAGYTIIRVDSREEAIEWSMRYPNPAGVLAAAEIEVREFFELEDFEQGPAIDRFRELGLIDTIATAITHSRPDLSTATAPNGTVTILFTDIEGSTQLTEQLGDDDWLTVLREHNEIVRSQVSEYSGFEVKSQGDGFMLAFPSAKDALRCAIGIQRALAAREPNGTALRVRIGVHTGEPIRDADDFYGKAVILAARIASEARGAEILASSLVRELTESSGEFAFEPPTEAELRGLSGIHQVSAVRWQEA
jgi:class 3 adenylate cyclase